jgi:arsenate reductase-like glutaredoxin family protein
MSCKKAQGFLERHAVEVKKVSDANKQKQGRAEALALTKTVNVIHVVKGKKIVTIDMNEAPDDDTLVGYLLGPTGNLRAPTIKKGKTLYVGFNEEAYQFLVQ